MNSMAEKRARTDKDGPFAIYSSLRWLPKTNSEVTVLNNILNINVCTVEFAYPTRNRVEEAVEARGLAMIESVTFQTQ
jgi:hypothetical protein